MRIVVSVCICLILSMTAEAQPKLRKSLSAGEPGTCSVISGQWEGECIEDGKGRHAKLQIFQDGCTDIGFYDFDYPMPQTYIIGREGRIQHTKYADLFANLSVYASWSDDQKTFMANVLANAEYTITNKSRRAKLEETLTVTLSGEILESSLKGETTSSDGVKEGYGEACRYKRAD